MIISRTPVRVSFLGGGTDYPEYFQNNCGMTLSATIDKYSYITVSHLSDFFEHNIRVSYSKTELAKTVDEIQHPAVRECMKFMGIEKGIEVNYVGDLPARTGLGSSSSFTVGFLHALYAYKGQMVDKKRLAGEAVHVERELIKERVGLQDQYACAIGGFLHLSFRRGAEVDVQHLPLPEDRRKAIQERLLLFYTGIQRNAHEILEEQIEKTKKGDLHDRLSKMAALVPRGVDVLCKGNDLSDFGVLLHENWLLKQRLSSVVSNSRIDRYYEAALRAGALGGKLCGAGGGGFMLLYVEPHKRESVRKALPGLLEVRFSFEDEGTSIIFYRP
jgi:D-glycero-alpha-D-manno-heptose-7-phosphate kinase